MTAAPQAMNSTRLRLRGFAYGQEVTLAVLLVTLFLVAGTLEPRFVRPDVQVELASELWPVAMVSLAMGLIIITGGIDLSVGAMTGLAAVTLGLTIEAGYSPWWGGLFALVVGSVCGALNGVLITRASVHPLIITLATMAMFRGIALALTRGRTIQGIPEAFSNAIQGNVLGLPLPMWLFLLLALAATVLLTSTPTGRFLYAIGHNQTAARLSGVPVRKIQLLLYTLSGGLCGLAAILLSTRYGQAKADFGTGLELEAITAVVLGGISILGGRGNIAGLLLGLLLLHETNKFVSWHWHVSELNSLITGGLLIGAVLINLLLTTQRRS
ncbi:ABC transporter permease [Aeoliella sp. SH292]|uniref:ABC transporter permease n=1 Tax=Aeoliella sp. SH292 TaxID=3454464 RepID=UPI003F99124B